MFPISTVLKPRTGQAAPLPVRPPTSFRGVLAASGRPDLFGDLAETELRQAAIIGTQQRQQRQQQQAATAQAAKLQQDSAALQAEAEAKARKEAPAKEVTKASLAKTTAPKSLTDSERESLTKKLTEGETALRSTAAATLQQRVASDPRLNEETLSGYIPFVDSPTEEAQKLRTEKERLSDAANLTDADMEAFRAASPDQFKPLDDIKKRLADDDAAREQAAEAERQLNIAKARQDGLSEGEIAAALPAPEAKPIGRWDAVAESGKLDRERASMESAATALQTQAEELEAMTAREGELLATLRQGVTGEQITELMQELQALRTNAEMKRNAFARTKVDHETRVSAYNARAQLLNERQAKSEQSQPSKLTADTARSLATKDAAGNMEVDSVDALEAIGDDGAFWKAATPPAAEARAAKKAEYDKELAAIREESATATKGKLDATREIEDRVRRGELSPQDADAEAEKAMQAWERDHEEQSAKLESRITNAVRDFSEGLIDSATLNTIAEAAGLGVSGVELFKEQQSQMAKDQAAADALADVIVGNGADNPGLNGQAMAARNKILILSREIEKTQQVTDAPYSTAAQKKRDKSRLTDISEAIHGLKSDVVNMRDQWRSTLTAELTKKGIPTEDHARIIAQAEMKAAERAMVGFSEAMAARGGIVQGAASAVAEKIPLVGGLFEVARLAPYADMALRLEAGEKLNEDELASLSEFARFASREPTALLAITDGVASSLSFGAEIALSAGTSAALKNGGMAAFKRALSYVTTDAAKSALVNATGRSALSTGKTLLSRVAQNALVKAPLYTVTTGASKTLAAFTRDTALQGVQVSEDEGRIIAAIGPDRHDAVRRTFDAFFGQSKEFLTEKLGRAIPLVGRMNKGNALGKSWAAMSDKVKNAVLTKAVIGTIKKLNPAKQNAAIGKFLKAANFQGLGAELLEERAGDVAEWAKSGIMDGKWDDFRIPTGKDLMVELATLIIPGAAGAVQAGRAKAKLTADIEGSDKAFGDHLSKLSDPKQAAAHLSKRLGEEVTESDVQAALDLTGPAALADDVRAADAAHMRTLERAAGHEASGNDSRAMIAQQMALRDSRSRQDIADNAAIQSLATAKEIAGVREMAEARRKESAELNTQVEQAMQSGQEVPADLANAAQRAAAESEEMAQAANRASALVKIARGRESSLTTAEQAALELAETPVVVEESGNLIITDAGRAELQDIAPTAATYVKQTETQRRDYLSRASQANAATPTADGIAVETAESPVVSGDGTTKGDAGAGSAPASPAPVQQVSNDTAPGNWTAKGTKGTPLTLPASAAKSPQQAAEEMAKLLPAGEDLDGGSVMPPRKATAKTSKQTQSSAAPSKTEEPAPAKTDTSGDTKGYKSAVFRAAAESTIRTMRPKAQAHATKVLQTLQAKLASHARFFSRVALKSPNGKGGGLSFDRDSKALHVRLADIAGQTTDLNDAELANYIETLVKHELSHRVITDVVTGQEATDAWTKLGESEAGKTLQQDVIRAYQNARENPDSPEDVNAWEYGHEMLRMYFEDEAFAGRVTEAAAVSPGLKEAIRNFLAKLSDYLRKNFAALTEAQRKPIRDMLDRAKARAKELGVDIEEAAPAPAVQSKDSRIAKGGDLAPAQLEITGNKGTLYTSTGEAVEYRWAVVEAADLIPSHTADGKADPRYDQGLQPRKGARTEGVNDPTVAEIRQRMSYHQLSDAKNAREGSPVVDEKLQVEAGNGRAIGLIAGYGDNSQAAMRYRADLIADAEVKGFDRTKLEAMKAPILIRQRLTNVDAAEFAADSNRGGAAKMTAQDQARADAANLTPDTLGSLEVSEDGDLFIPANMPFFQQFFRQTVGQQELAELVNTDGTLKQAGLARIRNAVFVAAYGDSDASMKAFERLAEAINDDPARNLSRAIMSAAPAFARINALAATGSRHDRPLSDKVAQAASIYAGLRDDRMTVTDYLSQGQLVSDGADELTRSILQFIEANKLSSRKMATAFRGYAQAVDSLGDPRQGDIFGSEPPTTKELWEIAAKASVELNAPARAPTPEEQAEIAAERADIKRRAQADGTWMKAPNGQPTKLNERQWVEVRTKRFKEWFGNWEGLSMQALLNGPSIASVTTGDIQSLPGEKASDAAKRWLAQNPQGNLSRAGLGRVIFDKHSIDTTLGHGFSGPKLNALVAVPDVVRSGIMIDNSRDHDGNLLENFTLAAPIELDGVRRTLIVRLRREIHPVKGTVDTPRFYVHEALLGDGTKNPAPSSPGTSSAKKGSGTGGTGFYVRLLQNIHAVNPDSVSKVIDENGEPMVVYHGTNASFDEFVPSKRFKIFGPGYYFIDKESLASGYGPKVVPAFLAVRNPKNLRNNNTPPSLNALPDGVISNGVGNTVGGSIFVATDPTQIKSATANRGTYSGETGNILHSPQRATQPPDKALATYRQLTKLKDKGAKFTPQMNARLEAAERALGQTFMFDSVWTPRRELGSSRRLADTGTGDFLGNLFGDQSASWAAKPVVEKPAEAATPQKPKLQAKANTDDAGEELTANRRGRDRARLAWSDIAAKNDTFKAFAVTKEAAHPRPDYAALINDGMTPKSAYVLKLVYDSIATKPVTRGTATDAQLQDYITTVQDVMDRASAWLNSEEGAQAMSAETTGWGVNRALFDHLFPDGVRNIPDRFRLVGVSDLVSAAQLNRRDSEKITKEIAKGWPAKQEAWQRQGFRIVPKDAVTLRSGTGYRTDETGRRIPVHVVSIGSFTMGYKDSLEEAQAIIDGYAPFLLIDKYGRIQSQHDTQKEAADAARAASSKARSGAVIDQKGISVAEAERTGKQHREPGEDITTERLMTTFGFRGVNFGNWMKGQSNAKERQLHVNHAYDSFHDLADLLNVPPKAMSLNGLLGLAIGAQGRGGRAAAHFVPGVNEINLTRTSGAGSLAHEWAHALDHHFGVQAGHARSQEPFITAHRRSSTVRPEIAKAFEDIVSAMRQRPPTEAEMAERRRNADERTANNIQGWLKTIRRDFESAKIDTDKFDALAQRVTTLDVGEGRIQAGSALISPALDEMRQLYKQTTGRTYSLDQIKGLQSNLDSALYRRDNAQAIATHIPQNVSTTYLAEARKIDDASGGKPYWATTIELFARAFDTYIHDKLAAREVSNTYLAGLNQSQTTAPQGNERIAINAAFDSLVIELKHRETDRGTELFSGARMFAGGQQVITTAGGSKITGEEAAREWIAKLRTDLAKLSRDSGQTKTTRFEFNGFTVRLQTQLGKQAVTEDTDGALQPIATTDTRVEVIPAEDPSRVIYQQTLGENDALIDALMAATEESNELNAPRRSLPDTGTGDLMAWGEEWKQVNPRFRGHNFIVPTFGMSGEEAAQAALDSKKNPAQLLASLPLAERKAAVQAAKTYGTNNKLSFKTWVQVQAAKAIDDAANEAATSPDNDTPQPTEAQKKAGNYKVGRVTLGGMDISIENPAGSTRSGKDGSGKPWSVTMAHHYGYIRGTEGKDGDHIDIFIQPGTSEDYSGPVFVVNQNNAQGQFDEHKAILGPNIRTPLDAKLEYLKNYSPGWKGAGSIAYFNSIEDFKAWVTERKRTAPAKGKSFIPKSLRPTAAKPFYGPGELYASRRAEAFDDSAEGMTFEDVQEAAITPAQKGYLAAVSRYISQDPRATGQAVGQSLKAHAGSDRVNRFLDGWRNLAGTEVLFIDTTTDPAEGVLWFQGLTIRAESDVLLIHTRSRRPLVAVLAHEWGHTLARRHKKTYSFFQKALLQHLDTQELRKHAQALLHPTNGTRPYRRQIVAEEITNNIIGDLALDTQFWLALRDSNPERFHPLWRTHVDFLAGLKSTPRTETFGTSALIKNRDAVRDLTVALFNEVTNNTLHAPARRPDGTEDGAWQETNAVESARSALDAIRAHNMPGQDELDQITRNAGIDWSGPDLTPEEVAQLADNAKAGIDYTYRQRLQSQTHAEWNEKAAELVENDPQSVIASLVNAARDNGAITNPVQIKAAQLIIPALMRQAIATRDMQAYNDAQVIAYAYDITGSEQGRALAARWQPHKTAEDKHREIISKMIFNPPADVQERAKAAKTPKQKQSDIARLEKELADVKADAIATLKTLEDQMKAASADITALRKAITEQHQSFAREKAALEREIAALKAEKDRAELLAEWNKQRLEQVEEGLAGMGVTLADLFISQEAVIRLRGSTIVKRALSGFNDTERKAQALRMEGMSDRQISSQTGISRGKLPAIFDRVDAALESAFGEWVDRGFTVESLMSDDLASELNAPARVALSADERKKRIQAFMGLVQPSNKVRGTGAAKRIKGTAPGFGFNISNPAHAVRVARVIQSIDSTGFDMAYEYWINGLLSGPATHAANVVGNAGNVALEYLIQRPAEAVVNSMIAAGLAAAGRQGGRDHAGASLSEYSSMAKYLGHAMSDAWHHAKLAWQTEASLFEQQWTGVGGINNASGLQGNNPRAAIKGTKGRVIRTPSRALMFADEFTKRLVGRIEAAAQAHRFGLAQGLSGAALDSYIKSQVSTPGSNAWIQAIKQAKAMTFQQDLPKFVEGLQRFKEAPTTTPWGAALKFLLRMLFPFIKTPWNITATGLRKTPLGTLRMLGKVGSGLYDHSKGKPFFDSYTRGEITQDLTEQIIGYAAFLMVAGMAEGDPDDDEKGILITGTRGMGTRSGERELLQRSRGGEMNILINGRPVFNYGRYEPFATVLATMVNSIRRWKETDNGVSEFEAVGLIAGDFVGTARSKTFFQGFDSLMSIVDDWESGTLSPNIWKSVVAGIVPNIIRQPLRNTDDQIRDTRNAPLLYHAFPVGSLAEPLYDLYGRPVMKGGTSASRILFTSPTDTHTPHPADVALNRWNAANPLEKYTPSNPSKSMFRWKDAAGKWHQMTPEQIAAYRRRAGQEFATQTAGVFPSPKLPTAEQIAELRRMRDSSFSATKKAMFTPPSLSSLLLK